MKTKSVSKPRTLLDGLSEAELKCLAQWDEEGSYAVVRKLIEKLVLQRLKMLIASELTKDNAVEIRVELAECKGRYEEADRMFKWPEMARVALKQVDKL